MFGIGDRLLDDHADRSLGQGLRQILGRHRHERVLVSKGGHRGCGDRNEGDRDAGSPQFPRKGHSWLSESLKRRRRRIDARRMVPCGGCSVKETTVTSRRSEAHPVELKYIKHTYY